MVLTIFGFVLGMLRDYQQDMLVRLQEAWQQHRSVMVQMPTGTGKTALMAEVIKEFRIKNLEFRGVASRVGIKNCCVLVVAHRRELIEQIRNTIKAFGIPEGLVVVESIQKLSKEISKAEANSSLFTLHSSLSSLHFSLIIVDEAHHALAKTYRMLWDQWPEAKFLGLTATPCRLSGEPFTALFDVLLQSWTIQEFIDKGYLSDFEYVSAAPDSMALRQIRMLQKRGADGDYQTKEMVTVMDVPESIEHLYNTYKAFADGKKGIVYAIDRQHAQHIAEYYNKRGVSCAVIDSKTPAEERRKIVRRYTHPQPLPCGRGDYIESALESNQTPLAFQTESAHECDQTPLSFQKDSALESNQTPLPHGRGWGWVDVLINVDIFSEGFDCPEVEFIQLARPTLSLSKYLQQVGRGMRVSEGKPHVLILDNVGLYQTFGLPTDERDWQLSFYGKIAGKGERREQTRPLVVDLEELDSGREKELVNLEMVRIKRRGEKHEGLEVIVQEGKYGVMYNGTVTCQPRYVKVRPLKDGGEFFALAELPQGVMGGKTTVISNQGIDLQMALYGEVTRRGDFFQGRNRKGEECYWDGIGREYYDRIPTFKHLGGLDLKPFMNGRYRLRRWPNLFVQGVKAEDIIANRNIAIIDDVLIVKGSPQRVYTIYGYMSDCVLVRTGRDCQLLEIRKDGTIGNVITRIPQDVHPYPNYHGMQLQAVT